MSAWYFNALPDRTSTFQKFRGAAMMLDWLTSGEEPIADYLTSPGVWPFRPKNGLRHPGNALGVASRSHFGPASRPNGEAQICHRRDRGDATACAAVPATPGGPASARPLSRGRGVGTILRLWVSAPIEGRIWRIRPSLRTAPWHASDSFVPHVLRE